MSEERTKGTEDFSEVYMRFAGYYRDAAATAHKKAREPDVSAENREMWLEREIYYREAECEELRRVVAALQEALRDARGGAS